MPLAKPEFTFSGLHNILLLPLTLVPIFMVIFRFFLIGLTKIFNLFYRWSEAGGEGRMQILNMNQFKLFENTGHIQRSITVLCTLSI